MTCAGPLLGGSLDGLERFQFAGEVETVAGFGFNGGCAVGGHFVERCQDMIGELFDGRFADAANAGADAATSGCDFFVVRTGDALFEVDQARCGEDGVGVGVDEAGKDDLAGAVDFFGGPWRVGAEFVGGADGSDFSVLDKDSTIGDDAEVAHLAPAPGSDVATQRKQLRGVRQK